MKKISIDSPHAKKEMLKTLKSGGLVIYPTETCYGVGVDATNVEAVTKVLKYKRRPEGKAISVAVSSTQMAQKYVELNESAREVYRAFLPGPVTVISTSKKEVDLRLESEKGTLGIRIPDYKFLLDVINEYGRPITSTSANVAGKKTPYAIEDITNNISTMQRGLIDLIIDAGRLPKTLPSTVIDTTTTKLKTYRKGRLQIAKADELVKKYETTSVEETIELGMQIMSDNI